jgi:hypothetical protein
MGLGEGEVGQQGRLGAGQQLGDRGEAWPEAVDHPVELFPGAHAVGLLDDHPHGRGDHAAGRAGHELLGVAGEVDPAALPGRAEERLVERLDQPGMVVADDQADAAEAAGDERAQEARPGRSLVVARG